jgi:hypothetical protein
VVGTAAKVDEANTNPNVDTNKVFDRENFDFKDMRKIEPDQIIKHPCMGLVTSKLSYSDLEISHKDKVWIKL